jgi:hypothetical protein
MAGIDQLVGVVMNKWNIVKWCVRNIEAEEAIQRVMKDAARTAVSSTFSESTVCNNRRVAVIELQHDMYFMECLSKSLRS